MKRGAYWIFREAKLKDYITLLLFRLPLIVIVLGGYNLALMTFHSFVDWASLYLYNPIIMFVGSLPITPAGLGTGQYLAVEFFKKIITSPLLDQGNLTPASLLLTSSLLWGLGNQFLKMLFGLFSLSRTSKDLFKE